MVSDVIVFIRSAGDRVQHIERHCIDVHLLQVKCHFHALIQRLAEPQDPTTADTDARLLGARYILRFFLCGVRGADLLEEGRGGFDIAMQTVDARLLQLVRLFLREEAEGTAYLDADLLADPTDQIQDLRKVLGFLWSRPAVTISKRAAPAFFALLAASMTSSSGRN